jgi:hypothetical protein
MLVVVWVLLVEDDRRMAAATRRALRADADRAQIRFPRPDRLYV